MIKLTLGTDSNARKDIQLVAACLRYIPAALAQFAPHSKAGNDKHNPGEPIHHARGKSMDHEECILRHLVDLQDIRAYIDREGLAFDVHVSPEHERAVAMLIEEARAEFWRAGIFLQELCETYLGAPLAPGAKLPAPAVPEGTVGEPDPWAWMDRPEGEKTFDDFMQEFTAPSDPTKLPRIVDGTPYGEAWAIVDGAGRLLGTHSAYSDAESCLREMLAPLPVNTPEESAELERARGKVVLVAGPALVDGGHVEAPPVICSTPGCWGEPGHTTPHADLDGKSVPDLIAESDDDVAFVLPPYLDEAERDEQAMRGNDPEAPLERCGHMSRTKRVCERTGGHAGAHADAVTQWAGIE